MSSVSSTPYFSIIKKNSVATINAYTYFITSCEMHCEPEKSHPNPQPQCLIDSSTLLKVKMQMQTGLQRHFIFSRVV